MEITREDLMFLTEISSTTLDQLMKKDLIPVLRRAEGRGGRVYFDLRDSITAFRNWQASAGKGDLTTAKTRRENALATLAEMDLAERRGETVKIEDVVKEVETEYHNLKAKLLAVPPNLSGKVLGMTAQTEIAETIDGAIRLALTELSDGPAVAKKATRTRKGKDDIKPQDETETD